MAKISKSITIHAPVEKIYDYISKSTNLPEIWPSLVEIKDFKSLPDGKTTDSWTYKMAGIHLKGTSTTEYVKNKSVISKTEGGARSIQTWTLKPGDGDTKVTFEVEYSMPIPVLGKLADAVAAKMNEHEGEIVLANLKARMESLDIK
jgi:uncharacterized membrane protein